MNHAEVENALAKANVLRMRGEVGLAKELCREILTHVPESEYTHALMGDIWADEGRLDEAIKWYELAASYHPESELIRQRLNTAHQHQKEAEAFETAQKLGIPTTKNKILGFTAVMLAMVAAIAGISFFLGRKLKDGESPGKVITREIAGNPVEQQATNPSVQTNEPSGIADDKALLDDLRKIEALGENVLAAWTDPRGGGLVVTLLGVNDRPLETVADSAARILDSRPTVEKVFVRLVDGTKTIGVAELSRKNLDRVRTSNDPLTSALDSPWPPSPTSEPAPKPTEQSTDPNPGSGSEGKQDEVPSQT